DAVETRHAQIQDGEVGLQLLGKPDRLVPGRRLAADLPVRARRQELPNGSANDLMIVRNENAYHRWLRLQPRQGSRSSNPSLAPVVASLKSTNSSILQCSQSHPVGTTRGRLGLLV